jgi:hypothetical protein
VISKARRSFWDCFDALPEPIRRAARQKYELWHVEPFHPSLHFKELQPGLWSVRLIEGYRALGWRDGDLILWFWIGSHADYDHLIRKAK